MGFKTLLLLPDAEHLHGATLAQAHLAELLSELSKPTAEPIVFLLDLSKAVSVTASYLRATVHWALLCGQAEVQEKGSAASLEPWAVRPLPLFPVVKKGNPEVMADVDDFFRTRSLPILVASKISTTGIKEARLLGELDPVLAHTLQALMDLGEATAGQLADRSKETITVNGWSNRLADLYLLRLVTRRREGKFWHYSPITKSITLWA
jgi:hypothetical protein